MADLAKANEPVPDMVKQFVVYFYRHIREKNVYEILSMYEKSFPAISEKYFKASPWPHAEAVARFADNDHVFGLMYKELYFRHVYGKVTPTLEQRCESWDNYCALFDIVLQGNVNMQLPNLWLWDMIDEYLYQFQSFCQYRGKVSVKTKQELELLKQCDNVWNAVGVLNYLQALVDKSGIVQTLANERESRGPDASFSEREGYDHKASNVLTALGYFALIGSCRVRCLLGEYEPALLALDPIGLDKPGLFTKVAGARVSVAYHVGFAYFMLGRYTDAARHFNGALLFVNRRKVSATKLHGMDLLVKKQEQMYAVLAMCVVLGGGGSGGGSSGAANSAVMRALEEGVAAALREKHGDDVSRMSQGVVSAYDDLFSFGCPKFVTPEPPKIGGGGNGGDATATAIDPGSAAANFNEEAYRAQLKLFLADVGAASKLPTLRSFLKLYASVSVAKLASLMEIDEPTLREQLARMKEKTTVLQWNGGASALDGSPVCVADVDFDVDDADVVHVREAKIVKRDDEYFLRHIEKQNALMADLAPAKPLVYKGGNTLLAGA